MQQTETDRTTRASAVDELAADASSRKRFLKALGGTAAAGAAASLLAACGEDKRVPLTPGGSNPNTGAGAGTDQYGNGDLGIVRYAIVLEYLEADFYAAANKSGKLKGRASELAKTFGQQEDQHVKRLEEAIAKLGGQPPEKSRGEFPLDTQQQILEFAAGIESLGAAALLAQVDRIQDKELLATAISIHSVEGRHAAAIAELLGEDPAPQVFATPTQASDVLNQLHRITTGNQF
jgi:hypothetical protein